MKTWKLYFFSGTSISHHGHFIKLPQVASRLLFLRSTRRCIQATITIICKIMKQAMIGAPCCARCYTEVSNPAELKACSKCHKRKYCSRECQGLDWKTGHRHFCGISGEAGIDWEVQACGDKGFGVFALQNIPKDHKIMAEHPVLGPSACLSEEMSRRYPRNGTAKEESTRVAIQSLHSPDPSNIDQKIELNAFDDEGGDSSLYVNLSRVNHSCLGNVSQRYSKNRGVRILVACRDIRAGEEIAFNYIYAHPREAAKRRLNEHYGFECRCVACTNPTINDDMEKMYTLESSTIMELAYRGKTELAIRKANQCLELYEKHHITTWYYHWIYFFMFQIAIMKRTTMKESNIYIQKAYEAALAFTSDPEDDTVKELKAYMQNPSSHATYLFHG
jgi:hypothetical protein